MKTIITPEIDEYRTAGGWKAVRIEGDLFKHDNPQLGPTRPGTARSYHLPDGRNIGPDSKPVPMSGLRILAPWIDLTAEEVEALRDINRGTPAVIKTAMRLAEMGLSVFHGCLSELTPAGLAALEAAEKGAKTEADSDPSALNSDPKDGNSDPSADHIEQPLTMVSPDVPVISDEMAAYLTIQMTDCSTLDELERDANSDGLFESDEVTDAGRAALAAWREAKAGKQERGADTVLPASPEPAGSSQNSPVDAANPATQPSGNPGQLSMNPCQLPRPAGLSPEMPWPVTPGYYVDDRGKRWTVASLADQGLVAAPYDMRGDLNSWSWLSFMLVTLIRPWREPAKFERTWMVFRTNRGKFVHELASVDGEQDEINYRAAEGSTLIARKVVTIAEGEGM